MRIAIQWLCLPMLILGALACGSEPDEPCSAEDAAAGRCQTTGAKPVVLPPGTVLPDWALSLCQDWRRPDGTCDQMEIMADYRECLSTEGAPKALSMRARGAGNWLVQRGQALATNTCLERRRWVMSEEAHQRWMK